MKKASGPKALRILVLMDKALVPPDSVEGMSAGEIAPFKTELDVYKTLVGLGHEVMKLGVSDDRGRPRATIGVGADGAVGVVLRAPDGTPRARLSTAPDGTPTFTLIDAKGRPVPAR